ncbi:MAG: helix-turn-helix domain-containing protein [Candidatus Rokubacteria bacterium]|nr:helix-turn-helix domain-containing protein [Candidatus Rokubacteria bacterium]
MTSIAAACALLDALATRRDPARLTDLATATGRAKSSTLRLLTSLVQGGLLSRDGDGRFSPGPLVTRLAALRHSWGELARRLRPELMRLVRQTRETASFAVRDGATRLLLVLVPSPESVRDHLEEGTRLPLRKGAAGEVLLAFGADRPRGALAEVRARGWAATFGARDPHLAAVAIPLFDSAGRLLGALTVSGPISRVTPDRVPSLVSALRSSRDRLARDLDR